MDEAAKAVAEAWSELAKHAFDIAHARMTLYRAYVSEGFTEAQAMELIKQI